MRQEQQLSALGDEGTDGGARYDDVTQAIVERGLHLGGQTILSCTVREGRPLYLTRAEVQLNTDGAADLRPLTLILTLTLTLTLALTLTPPLTLALTLALLQTSAPSAGH